MTYCENCGSQDNKLGVMSVELRYDLKGSDVRWESYWDICAVCINKFDSYESLINLTNGVEI